MMRDGTRIWRVWAAMFAVAWCAVPVLAQVPNNVIIVGANTADPDIFTNDLQEGIQEAISRSRGGEGRVTIFAQDDAAPFGPISIPADADIEIFGIHVGPNPELRNASSLVVQGVAGDAAITIHTESAPNFLMGDDNETEYLGGTSDTLVLHDLAPRGGNNGVLLDANGDAYAGDPIVVFLDGLYAHENVGMLAGEGNGIRVAGPATAVVTNSSIWGNGDRAAPSDEGAGISLGASATLFALHNTIILNENYGIHSEAANNATIRNTIVYRNGDEDEQIAIAGFKDGGVVWDVDPFITPNIGPVSGGIAVSMFGDFVGTSGVTTFNVFFGPPDLATPVPATDAGGVLTVTLPAAYRGVPGPVDVYIVRTDGYQVRVPQAFTYVNDAGDAPLVSQVVPEWGEVVGGNFVFVLGARFEPDCDVFFDFDSDTVLDANEMSEKVTFLSSGELYVKVPDASATIAATTKVEVYVRNNRTGLDSPATLPDDYEYRVTGDIRPSIVHISPDYFRDTEGDEGPPTPAVTSNILVWNLEPANPATPNPVVKIGDIVVPYASVQFVDGPFTPQPALDSDGGFLYEIVDVEIPVSEFGGGGAYDVTVINPSGLSDTLNAGFTYYADGIPRPDPNDGHEWLPANFVAEGTGGGRTLRGSAYDTTIEITVSEAFFGTSNVFTPLNPMMPAPPTPYVSHTQRAIEFNWPPAGSTVTGVNATPNTLSINVDNLFDADGDISVGAAVQNSRFYYLNQARAFDIYNVQVAIGTIDAIYMSVSNYSSLASIGSSFAVYVDDIDVGPLTQIGTANRIYFNVPTPAPGTAGPVNIRVQTPNNPAPGVAEPLYYVAEGGYSYRRTDPQAHGVFPRTIPVDTTIRPSPVRVRGADFTGPFTPSTPYTRVWLDGNDNDLFDGAGTDVNVTQLVASQIAASYSVYSFSEIEFTADFSATVLPVGAPITLFTDTFDPTTNAVIAGPTRLLDAVTLEAAPPEITDVQLVVDPTRRDGPVRGGTPVRVIGFNFGAGGIDPIVRIGGEQAQYGPLGFVPGGAGLDTIDIITPPAPDLLPGTYKVVVIRPLDQQQGVSPPNKDYTYFLDGAPEILEIVPNHVPYPIADDDPRYITIKGINFTDIVEIVFDPAGSPTVIDHYSVSPTEIVVKVPLGTDTNAILSSPPGGAVTIPLLVRNVPSDGTAVVATTNESNPENIIIFDDDTGIEPNVVTLEFNNVFHNSNDYVMVQPGTGSVSLDPMLDPRAAPINPGLPGPKLVTGTPPPDPWVGKLAMRDINDGIVGDNTTFENPMRDKAGEFTLTPLTDLDFELENRPDFNTDPLDTQGTGPAESGQVLPDIGADEISAGGALAARFGWYYANPVPNPVPALDAGDLSFLVAFRPAGFVMDPFDAFANSTIPGTVNDVSFFIVPQGGDPTVDADRIPLTAVQEFGGGRYLLTNSGNAIETLLEDRDATNDPTAGDLIADGHAAIYVRPNPNEPLFLLGDHPTDFEDGPGGVNPNGSVTIDGVTFSSLDNAIYSQAVLGRHFLIDTLPPRANVDLAGPYFGAIESHEVVLDFNDTFTVPAITAMHPTVPTGAGPDFTPWYPAVVLAPLDTNQTVAPAPTPATDNGVTLPPTTGPNVTSVFFNPFSIANGTGGVDLQFRVAVEFLDPPVTDGTGTLITGVDFYTGTDDPRQVSGFEPSFATAAVDGDENVLDGPVRWDVLRGSALLQDSVATPVQISNDFATGGPNLGVFDLTLEPDEAMSNPANPGLDSNNGTVLASWGGPADATTDPMFFVDATAHLNAALTGGFNLSIQFDGEDLAGNDSTDDADNTLLNPLNIFWYRDANSEISGIAEGGMSSNPIPTFSMIRDGDPSPAPDGGPRPIYSYRAYASSAYRGIYTDVGGWSDWIGNATVTTLPDVLPPDSWILLVVHGADESGNVEPWDLAVSDNGPLDMTDPAGDLLHQYALNQPNWVRFFFSGSAPPETRVRANFWHDDKVNNSAVTTLIEGTDVNLGNITIVPMPGAEAVTNRRVVGEFFISVDVPPEYNEATDEIDLFWEFFRDGVFLFNGTDTLATAAETRRVVIPAFDADVGLGDQNLLEDITYVLRATATIRRSTLPPGVAGIADPSPANVLFTVVPLDTQTFVAQALDPDRQPIVILEEQ